MAVTKLQNHEAVRPFVGLGLSRSTDGNFYPAPLNIAAKTTAYSILQSDPCGTCFTNRGASGSVTFTLPAPGLVPNGTFYYFLGHADQNIVIATATADTMVTKNDVAADSVAMSTSGEKIGGLAIAILDGTQWFVVGLSVGHTFTVTTN